MESNNGGFVVNGGCGCDVVSEMVSSDSEFVVNGGCGMVSEQESNDGEFVVNDRCGVVSENANVNSNLAKASEAQSWIPLAQA